MSRAPLLVLTISSREFSEYILWADMYLGLHQAGIVTVSIDTSVESIPVREIVAEADGLILGGGGDVSPFLYGGDPFDTALRGVNVQRDASELVLLQHALQKEIPVLGICRGAQLINVARGGTLLQDVERDFPRSAEHQGPEDELHRALHAAQVSADSLLATLLGSSGSLDVNSAHHQAIGRVGRDLRVVAAASDGLIEAIESTDPEEVILGVQWHPENLWRTQRHARQLLDGFGKLCLGKHAMSTRPARLITP